jgi:DNA-binding NtrC family response regulator
MTKNAARIYVVDDDASSREAIIGVIRSAGFDAVGLDSAPAFLSHPREAGPACLVLDVEMPELSGLDLQQRLNAANDALPIIFVTGYGDVPMSVTAIRAGAVDFLTKPLDADALLDAVQRALSECDARDGAPVAGHAQSDQAETLLDGIVGTSLPLRSLLQQVKTVATTDTTVLIQGETGTGKERIARALHELSQRKEGRFVKVNCAAIPTGLLESELMGHEKGAFTGAVAQRIGRFELADNGTIFLDEIGELPLDLQPKLLRVLQEREFERVGSTRTVRSNARVIAATNRDLRAMAAERTFREDLYYRLSVFPMIVPPLRERRQDLPLLAQHFVREVSARLGKQVEPLSSAALSQLAQYHWPGNIRELQNVVERAVILAQNGVVSVSELVAGILPPDGARLEAHTPSSSDPPRRSQAFSPRSDGLAEVSKAHILRVLNETNWVVAGPKGAAARLEMKRSTLNFRMKKLGIVRPGPRAPNS